MREVETNPTTFAGDTGVEERSVDLENVDDDGLEDIPLGNPREDQHVDVPEQETRQQTKLRRRVTGALIAAIGVPAAGIGALGIYALLCTSKSFRGKHCVGKATTTTTKPTTRAPTRAPDVIA